MGCLFSYLEVFPEGQGNVFDELVIGHILHAHALGECLEPIQDGEIKPNEDIVTFFSIVEEQVIPQVGELDMEVKEGTVMFNDKPVFFHIIQVPWTFITGAFHDGFHDGSFHWSFFGGFHWGFACRHLGKNKEKNEVLNGLFSKT